MLHMQMNVTDIGPDVQTEEDVWLQHLCQLLLLSPEIFQPCRPSAHLQHPFQKQQNKQNLSEFVFTTHFVSAIILLLEKIQQEQCFDKFTMQH